LDGVGGGVVVVVFGAVMITMVIWVHIERLQGIELVVVVVVVVIVVVVVVIK